ncbi:MAG: PH domain-containing protein [Candidatus Methylarchaceae archaeon HK02M1]|nr:PH domain-containing protein [Candidatus Methylarchaceae archaeon HK02M1]
MKETQIRIDEEFQPAPQFKRLYFIYLMLVIPIVVLTWYIPVMIFAPFIVVVIVTLGILLPILVILIFTAYWIPRFYDTMIYKLTNSEMTWRRGVWFKKTGIVPYNRITNVDIAQGPISRGLRIASLKIQTAGYSTTSSGRSAEIRIDGIEQFEDLREQIMEFVRGKRPVAVETYEEDTDLKILNELVKIRELLEKSSEK